MFLQLRVQRVKEMNSLRRETLVETPVGPVREEGRRGGGGGEREEGRERRGGGGGEGGKKKNVSSHAVLSTAIWHSFIYQHT